MVYIPFISSKETNHHGSSGTLHSDGRVKHMSTRGKDDDGDDRGSGNGTGEVAVINTVSFDDMKKSASAYTRGGGQAITIADGHIFAGRKAGGATREQIFGTRVYGSGYPDEQEEHGVAGRDFPFIYWPIVWTPSGSIARPSLPAYIYLADGEYGPASNSSRPGGPLAAISLPSLDAATHTSFRLISDNLTVSILLPILRDNCASHLSMFTDTRPKSFDISFPIPKPEEAVQYYRGSSIALSLDGYNNSQVLMFPGEVEDAQLPTGIDIELMNCLNSTIGSTAPLVGAASPPLWTDNPMCGMGVSLVFVAIWWFFAML